MNISKPVIARLIKAAAAARLKAYAPYSKFKVGAALLAADGRVFTGCNVENASYGATICAERVAVGSAIAAGCTGFLAVAIVYHQRELADPCGLCRQVLHEFGDDIVVIRANLGGGCECTTVGALLPGAFSLKRRKEVRE
jgi:cytidine deaminase